jgi:pyruvate-formate lyase-activating enzyme
MVIKGLIEEDFTNYKKPCMFIAFPCCTFKCDKEAGCQVCQNSELANARGINVDPSRLVELYMNNRISKAICFGGLEPFDSYDDMLELIQVLRESTSDDIVIYTGYTEEEVADKVTELKSFPNLIVKFGRFRYGEKSVFDETLGISLASGNQYAIRIS